MIEDDRSVGYTTEHDVRAASGLPLTAKYEVQSGEETQAGRPEGGSWVLQMCRKGSSLFGLSSYRSLYENLHSQSFVRRDVGLAKDPSGDRAMRGLVRELPQEGALEMSDADDPVHHPKHYSAGGFEAIKVIEAWELGFCLGNTVKYISRAGKKAGNSELQDLEKAAWYLNRRIEQIKGA